MYRLFLDSDSDATLELCKKYGASLISMPYEIEGKEIFPYETWEEFDYKKFYQLLAEGIMGTTFSITVHKYIEYFEPVFKAGEDIVYIHFSDQMSSTFTQMNEAVKMLLEKYPERKFYSADTKSIAIGAHAINLEVLKMYQNKAKPEDIIKFVENEREHFACYYFVDSLKHFARSGRVSGVAAFVGGIIGIKPIIYMSADGKMSIIAKEKGKINALNRLIKYMEDLGDNIKDYTVVIEHALTIDNSLLLKQMIIDKFGKDIQFDIHPLNPTAGCHCGPECVGVAFHSKSR